MENRVLKTLEFDKIREIVATYCTSSAGRSMIEELVPVSQFDEVVRLLEEMDEGLSILRVRGNVPMGGISDVRPHAKRAQMGGMLSAFELMEIANTIRASRILRQFIEAIVMDEDIEIPHFIAKKDAIPVLTGLEHEINACIDDNGHVVDSASGGLRSIRQGFRIQEGRVREKIGKLYTW